MENLKMRLCWTRGSNGSEENSLARQPALPATVLKTRWDSTCCRDVELREYLWLAKIRGELGEAVRTGMPLSSLFLLHAQLLSAMLSPKGKNTKNQKPARWVGWSGAFLFWKRWSWSWNFCSSPACGQQQCYTVLTVSITVFIVGSKWHSPENITGKKQTLFLSVHLVNFMLSATFQHTLLAHCPVFPVSGFVVCISIDRMFPKEKWWRMN